MKELVALSLGHIFRYSQGHPDLGLSLIFHSPPLLASSSPLLLSQVFPLRWESPEGQGLPASRLIEDLPTPFCGLQLPPFTSVSAVPRQPPSDHKLQAQLFPLGCCPLDSFQRTEKPSCFC